MSFSLSVKQFVDDTKKEMERVTAETADELLATVTDRTPIDEGNAKASWHMDQYDNRYRIYNTASYFYVLEFGLFPNPPKQGTGKTVGGYSTQAPQGIVGITVAEFPQIVTRVTRRK